MKDIILDILLIILMFCLLSYFLGFKVFEDMFYYFGYF